MNSPVRATPDMKADVAQRAPILLAQSDAVPAAARGGVIALDRPSSSGTLNDIAAARMKDLANRLAAGKALQKAADIDAPLELSDVEIQPVSLAAITGLRGLAIADADNDWLPTTPMLLDAPAAPILHGGIAPTPLSAPTASMKSSETASERNLQSLLTVLDPPAPLRFAAEVPFTRLIGAPTSVATTADDETPAAESPDEIETAHPTHWVELEAQQALVANEPLKLPDQSDGDIRLVDLIKRQKSLLDQLNRYPPVPAPEDASMNSPAAPPTPWPFVDQLAPTLPFMASEQRRAPFPEAPPPLPSSGMLRLAGPSPEDAEHMLTERSPMIIQRARAELSGRHGARKSAAQSSPIPAFAAGVAVAFAIAGSLLLVL